MSEKVYLVTGSELANFSKEKITLALNWVISTAGDHPELSVVELASLLKENVNTAIGDNEEWVYGVTGAQETVAELELPTAEPVGPEATLEYSFEEPEVEEVESEPEVEEVESEPVVDEYIPVVEDVYDYDAEDEESEVDELPEDEEPEVEEEKVELVEVLIIDVENAILNVINSSESKQVTIDELRAGLGDAYNEEQFGQGFWNLVEANTIRFDDATGYIELVTFEPTSHAEEVEETVEEEPEVEETVEEETDFFSAPVVSRAKQYQGLFREAGQIDR